MSPKTAVITGAFGYSGAYMAREFLARGYRVRTLTNRDPGKSDLAGRLEIHPMAFANPVLLRKALRRADVLVNNYWVRFNHRDFNQKEAVDNTKTLFSAAAAEKVRRLIHVSITNPALDSDLEYFRGKAELERDIQDRGFSYAILRPAVFFGGQDILINNIAWMLRNFPVFGVFGRGDYRMEPIHVGDFAGLAARAASNRKSEIIQAVGPESFSYRELVRAVSDAIRIQRPVISIPPFLGYWAGRAIGAWKGDKTITWDEIQGLMRGLLHVEAPPAGKTRFSAWAKDHGDDLGKTYASELQRRRQP